jgi:hypothetical protein
MKLEFDHESLRPFIRAVVGETLAMAGGDRIGFDEAEAAGLCGMAKCVLRDARLRGEVKARRVGKKMYYAKSELQRFLTDSRD